MDFYSSPITVEVDGVDVRLKVSPKDDREKPPRRRGKRQEDSDVIPTAADLAQSFLQGQESAERRELEEALAAETQDLGASMTMSESGSDEDIPYGTGQALSLPVFLTDFLQGVVDRTQICIRAVTFQLDVELPVDANAATPDLVTFQLAVEGINVEGVTTPELGEDGTPKIVSKEGKRHITLDNIRAVLISEANVFSTLVRSPSMPSSVDSQSPVLSAHQPPVPRQPTTPEMSASEHLMTFSDELLGDSEDAFNIPYDLSDPNEEFDPQEPASPVSTPRASIYQGSSPRPHEPHAQSEIVEAGLAAWGSFEREAQSEPYLQHAEHHQPEPRAPSPGPLAGSDHESSGPISQPSEDLTQSHLYSHEDAESMYMSAFSQTDSTRLRSAMPGAWGTEDSPSPEASPQAKRVASPPIAQRSPSPIPFYDESTDVQIDDMPVETEEEEEAETAAESATEHVAAQGEAMPSDAERDTAEVDAQQDDVPTPRGPTRLVKEILSLASITIYVPSNHKHIQILPPDLGKSASPNLPGAFSVHSEAPTSPEMRPQVPMEEREPPDKAFEIILAETEIRFDASIGFLLAMVVSKLFEAARGQPDTAPAAAPTAAAATAEGKTTSTSSQFPEVKIMAEHVSLLFLEKLAGVADTPARLFSTPTTDFNHDVLLKADLQNLGGTMSASGQQTDTTINIEKFTFGYANHDIISFDRRIQMFESVMNTFPSAGNDISIKISQTPDSVRCNIDTLPLHAKLDLQRLDETFSWFGGLSSFLNMGSSMTSNASRGARSPVKVSHKPRGVRFEAPVKPDDQSAAKENKVAMRINGFRLDLIGRECSVVLDTSALKLVSREEAIGVHFSRIRLSGPYLKNSRGEPPIVADILGTRLEYLAVPQNADLERLLELITPSKVKFDESNDEIMVDTLLRQRRKGSVLRLTLDKVNITVGNVQQLRCLPNLGEELAKLGTVAKYLPEDDRPGLLTLGLVKEVEFSLDIGGRFGAIHTSLRDLDLAHITLPSLVAVAVSTVTVSRNRIEELVATSTVPASGTSQRPPVLMMRIIDDMEPVLKVKLMGLVIEYRVPTIMDVLGLAEDATPQDFEASLAASVANLGGQAHTALKGKQPELISTSEQPKSESKPMAVDVAFRDCLIGLNPLGLTSKLVFALSDAHVDVAPFKDNIVKIVGNLRKSSVLLIDDITALDAKDGGPALSRRRPSDASSPQVVDLCSKGFVDICQISSARATARVTRSEEGDQHVDVELRDDLLVLETCADSTQTLITLINALKPPTPPTKEIKYKTSVVPVQNLLASLTADAFGRAEGDYDFDYDFAIPPELGDETDSVEDFYGEGSSPLELDPRYYEEAAIEEQLFDAGAPSMISERTTAQDTRDGVLLTNLNTTEDLADSSGELEVQEDYFGTASVIEGTAHRWNSSKNTYDRSNDGKVLSSPLKICVRDVHIIWNLFDGYDWTRTRDVITKAVQDVETKAYEQRARTDRRAPFEQDFDEQETVIGDFLFNSIYIGIPANRDPRELAQAINQELNDNATETESIATTAITATPGRAGGNRSKSKKLKLNRSRRHKITFELKGVNVDLVTFPPGSGETQSSIDVRIRDLDVFDHVPTSTWKKFAMYDQDAGEREMGTSMAHLEILNVQPVPHLPASEIVLRVTLLPLRLHVDQDALDFITRFFEFKDDSAPVHASPSDVPFIQRAEVNSVPVKLDFKPKRVDYAGLRSGHTTEFMNFLILEDARMVMRHTIIYGVSGFDRLGQTLNDVWMPDIKRTQLPGILAGLAPVRSLVNVGSGIKDLIEIPIREYKKDGRIVRSIGKGAAAFARTTGTEIVKLGAKLAVGTQYALQGAEGMLVKDPHAEGSSAGGAGAGWEDEEYSDAEEKKQISLYADQPTGMVQGLRGAYSSLTRDLYLARDAVIAVPGEVMESQSAQGAAKAVLKRAPTIIFRPAIGATKAIGQTLLGATNSLDPENRRRVDAVSAPDLARPGNRPFYDPLWRDILTWVTEIQEALNEVLGAASDTKKRCDGYIWWSTPTMTTITCFQA